MDLTTHLLPNLTLRDPYMLSPSHWTANERSLTKVAATHPAALTLKTTSNLKGGDGNADFGARCMRRLQDSRGNHFATFTDGPATLELLDVAATFSLTRIAKGLLPDTKLGLSVLQGEDYQAVAGDLLSENYDYVELNLKYSLRGIALPRLQQVMDELKMDIDTFIEAFAPLPKFVKVPRELTALLSLADFGPILSMLAASNVGVIVANSLRTRVPPSRAGSDRDLSELINGVIVGEHLYLDTYSTVRALALARQAGASVPPLVASGGVVDVGGVVDLVAAGASAVQLCSALDIRGPSVLPLLRQQLQTVGAGYTSLSEFSSALQHGPTWAASATTARDLRVDERKSVENIFDDEAAILQHLRNALVDECSLPWSEDQFNTKVQVPEGLRFVVSNGNISTFLLGHRVVDALSLSPLPAGNAADFCRGIVASDLHWDLAIIPASSLGLLLKSKARIPEERQPTQVARVAKSTVHLMGLRDLPLKEVTGVCHFSGNSTTSLVISSMNAIH